MHQTEDVPTRSQLLLLQQRLNTAAASLSLAIDLLPDAVGVPASSRETGNVIGIQSRLSPEARQRIRDANRHLWVVCPKPECGGVRHRKTHPHLRRSVKLKAA